MYDRKAICESTISYCRCLKMHLKMSYRHFKSNWTKVQAAAIHAEMSTDVWPHKRIIRLKLILSEITFKHELHQV